MLFPVFNAFCFLLKATSYLVFLLLYCRLRLLNPFLQEVLKNLSQTKAIYISNNKKGYINSIFECLMTVLVGLFYYLFLRAVLPGVRWLYSQIYNAFSSSWKGHMLSWLTLFNLSFAGVCVVPVLVVLFLKSFTCMWNMIKPKIFQNSYNYCGCKLQPAFHISGYIY